MEIDVNKILLLSSKLNNLLEGFDEFYFSKKNSLSIKDKLLVFLLKDNFTPHELIKILGVAKSNLALMLADLQKNNYITKIRDIIDKRNIIIMLTDKGKNKANEILESINKNVNNTLAFKNNSEEINTLLDEITNIISI